MTANDSSNDTSWQKKVTVFSMPSQGKTGERFYTERYRFQVLAMLEQAFLATPQEDGKFLAASVEIRVWKNDRVLPKQVEAFLGMAKGLHEDLRLLIQGKCKGDDGVVRDLVDESGAPIAMPVYCLEFERKDGYELKEMRREVPLYLLHRFFKAQMQRPDTRDKHSPKFGKITYFDQALRVSKSSTADGTAELESECIGWATGQLPKVPVIKGDKVVVRSMRSMGYLVFVPGKSMEMLLSLYPRMEAAYYREMVSTQHDITEKGGRSEHRLLRARNERAPESEQKPANGTETVVEGKKRSRKPRPPETSEQRVARLAAEVPKYELKAMEAKGTDKEAKAAQRLTDARERLVKAKADLLEPKPEAAAATSDAPAPN